MKDFISSVDTLPFFVKLLICLPVIDLVWAVYRIIKGVSTENTFLLIIGIIWVLGACSVGWLIDIITLAIYKERPALT